MSTALTIKEAADLARRVSAAHAAIEATDDWEAYEEYNPYLFIRLLPPYPTVRPRITRTVLPAKHASSPDISLVLDLDETLVHCSVEPIPDPDVTFPVVFGGQTYQVYVRKRPFLERFLARMADRFEVTVFTASQSVYAERLLDIIDPEKRFIRHRLYREACLNVDGNYVKDLTVLGRDLRKTLLVDNSPHAFGYQLDNGVPIESWFEDPDDRELLKLAWFLEKEVHGSADVRPVIREKFRMRMLVDTSY
jgi:CTD small phosphatase-like protein 2